MILPLVSLPPFSTCSAFSLPSDLWFAYLCHILFLSEAYKDTWDGACACFSPMKPQSETSVRDQFLSILKHVISLQNLWFIIIFNGEMLLFWWLSLIGCFFFSYLSVKILLRQTRHTTWKRYVSVRLISCPYQHLLTMSNQKAPAPIFHSITDENSLKKLSLFFIMNTFRQLPRVWIWVRCVLLWMLSVPMRQSTTPNLLDTSFAPSFFFHILPLRLFNTPLDNDWKE